MPEINPAETTKLRGFDTTIQHRIYQAIALLRSRYSSVDVQATLAEIKEKLSSTEDLTDDAKKKEEALASLNHFEQFALSYPGEISEQMLEVIALTYMAACDTKNTKKPSKYHQDIPKEIIVGWRNHFFLNHLSMACQHYGSAINPASFLGMANDILGSIDGWHSDVDLISCCPAKETQAWERMIMARSHWWQQSTEARQPILNNWLDPNHIQCSKFKTQIKQDYEKFVKFELTESSEEISEAEVDRITQETVGKLDSLPVPYELPLFIEKLLAAMQQHCATETTITAQLQQLAASIYTADSFEISYATISPLIIQIALLSNGSQIVMPILEEALIDDGARLKTYLIANISTVTNDEKNRLFEAFSESGGQAIQECCAAAYMQSFTTHAIEEPYSTLLDNLLKNPEQHNLARACLYIMLTDYTSPSKAQAAQQKISGDLLVSENIEHAKIAIHVLTRVMRLNTAGLSPWAKLQLITAIKKPLSQGNSDRSEQLVRELIATEDITAAPLLIELAESFANSIHKARRQLSKFIVLESAQSDVLSGAAKQFFIKKIEKYTKTFDVATAFLVALPFGTLGAGMSIFSAILMMQVMPSFLEPFIVVLSCCTGVGISFYIALEIICKLFKLPSDIVDIITSPQTDDPTMASDLETKKLLRLRDVLNSAVFHIVNANLRLSIFHPDEEPYVGALMKRYACSRDRHKTEFSIDILMQCMLGDTEARRWAQKAVRKFIKARFSKGKTFAAGVMLAITLTTTSGNPNKQELYNWTQEQFIDCAKNSHRQAIAMITLFWLAQHQNPELHRMSTKIDETDITLLEKLLIKFKKITIKKEIHDWVDASLNAIQTGQTLPFCSMPQETDEQESYVQITGLLAQNKPQELSPIAEKAATPSLTPELSHASIWQQPSLSQEPQTETPSPNYTAAPSL
jgi:hypothetical protein